MITSTNYLSQAMWNSYASFTAAAKGEVTGAINFQDLAQREKTSDPKQQLMEDYYAWKAQQPPQYLPESKGDTAENRAYLERNFKGDLSLYERIYALDTMREMGMITESEMQEAIGVLPGGMSVIHLSDAGLERSSPLDLDPEVVKWADFFSLANISRNATLDKLYKLLDILQKSWTREDRQTDPGKEIEEILQSLTNRKLS